MSNDTTTTDLSRHSRDIPKKKSGECPLRKPAQHVKKSIWAIYMAVMTDVFSNSSWNGW